MAFYWFDSNPSNMESILIIIFSFPILILVIGDKLK